VFVPKYTHISCSNIYSHKLLPIEDKDLIGVGLLIVLKLCH